MSGSEAQVRKNRGWVVVLLGGPMDDRRLSWSISVVDHSMAAQRSETLMAIQNTKIFRDFRAGNPCPYCARPMFWNSPQTMPTREHRIPLSRGGAKTGPNVILACHQCNQTKGQMTEAEYLEWIVLGRPNKRVYLRSLGLFENDRNMGQGPNRRLSWQETVELLRTRPTDTPA